MIILGYLTNVDLFTYPQSILNHLQIDIFLNMTCIIAALRYEPQIFWLCTPSNISHGRHDGNYMRLPKSFFINQNGPIGQDILNHLWCCTCLVCCLAHLVYLLPPANEVSEGYVFTGACLSTGGSVIILNTISKRQDGLGFIGKNGYIFHDSSCCIEVPIGGAYAHMFEDLLQVISYNIPLFSLIQMLKFVLHILNLKWAIMSE